ncbi:hypothetical protein Syun_012604 [Stephania yunnanensis]|uniref:Uncharacterized protein n=1 Tax=Stephania yunnanensis TaxID=152371 RepID=A0AAP0K0J0_9MAGN
METAREEIKQIEGALDSARFTYLTLSNPYTWIMTGSAGGKGKEKLFDWPQPQVTEVSGRNEICFIQSTVDIPPSR